MLTYFISYEDDEVVEYTYYAEGNPEWSGKVSVSKLTCDVVRREPSDMDRHEFYFLHILRHAIRSAERGEFENNGMIAWY